jgi:hypothetical protein
MSPSHTIQDAEPDAWKGGKKPDPTPAELRLGRAAREFAKAAEAVETHDGPRSGDDYQAKVAGWKSAYRELREAAKACGGEG